MVEKVRPQWLKVGRQVRQLREAQGISQEQLSRSMTVEPAMLSAIERGIRGCKPEYAQQIDQALNTEGKIARLLDSTLNTGSGLAAWAHDVVQLQQQASEIRQFQLGLVPGLLQTEEYARTMLRGGQPHDTETEIEEQVQTRIRRQDLLERDKPPVLLVVLDHSVLFRPVGGHEIMGRQLGHLMALSDSPYIVIQVVPTRTPHHPGLSGSFQLIRIPHRTEVAYLETLVSGTPIDDVDHVGEYARMFGELRGVAAQIGRAHV